MDIEHKHWRENSTCLQLLRHRFLSFIFLQNEDECLSFGSINLAYIYFYIISQFCYWIDNFFIQESIKKCCENVGNNAWTLIIIYFFGSKGPRRFYRLWDVKCKICIWFIFIYMYFICIPYISLHSISLLKI